MPYIPRSLSPSTLNSESVPRAPLRSNPERPPVPYLGSNPTDPNPLDKLKKKPNQLMSGLNMMTWDVDPAKVYKNMTDKELNVDGYSRLVSNPR